MRYKTDSRAELCITINPGKHDGGPQAVLFQQITYLRYTLVNQLLLRPENVVTGMKVTCPEIETATLKPPRGECTDSVGAAAVQGSSV
jgi:hypothetical protein